MSDTHLVFEGRVVAVETKLETLTSAVHDLTKAVRDVMSRPQNIAWREVAITAGAFLALFAYVGNFLESQHAKNVAVDKWRIAAIERALCLAKPEFCVLFSKN
jgi:hypothetical protein